MKIITNDKLIKRNKTIGRVATFTSLAILAGGLLLAFNNQQDVRSLRLSFAALVVGFILSQVGIYYGVRFARSPSPYESLNQCLKGLDDKYSLYHYITPIPHVLVGPAGIWVLGIFFQPGTITYNEERKKYHQAGRSMYNKFLAQEGIGRPDIEVGTYREDLGKYLEKLLSYSTEVEVKVAVVFTSEKAKVQAQNAPFPTLHSEKLKDFIRKQAKESPASEELINKVKASLAEL
jgi:hypothetical protein